MYFRAYIAIILSGFAPAILSANTISENKFLKSLRGKAVQVSSLGETRQCNFSHLVESGGATFFCPGSPDWILAAADTWQDGTITWVLLNQDKSSHEPKRIPPESIFLNQKLLFAENKNSDFYTSLPSRENFSGMPSTYYEFAKYLHTYNALAEPYQEKVLGDSKIKKYFFFPPKKGEKMISGFLDSLEKMAVAGNQKFRTFKAALNPNTVQVQLKNGKKLTCKRNNSLGQTCEFFTCEEIIYGKKKFQPLLQFTSDPFRPGENGLGSVGPHLFALQNPSEAKSFSIQSISAEGNVLFSASPKNRFPRACPGSLPLQLHSKLT